MKKFTDSINEKTNHYSGDKKLYNEIYNLIEETLSPKMDGEDSERVSLIGKESLVKELSKIVENEITKTKISVLENFKGEPTMIKESVEEFDELTSLITEANVADTYQKIAKVIKSCETEEQCNGAEKMIDTFKDKDGKVDLKKGMAKGMKDAVNVDDRVKELKDELKSKRADLKKVEDKK